MRILLIPGCFYKAEGKIAKGIAGALSDYQIHYFAKAEIARRNEEFRSLVRSVDVVHWLFNVGNLQPSLEENYMPAACPTIASVYHVCPWERTKIVEASRSDTIHVISQEWLELVGSATLTPVFLAHAGIDPIELEGISAPIFRGGQFRIGVVGMYGQIRNRKRFDVLVRAVEVLTSRGLDVRLVLQGSGWGENLDTLRDANIPFDLLGFRSGRAILDVYRQIHCLVCTADWEGGPLTVLEALHCGVPVVSTRVGVSMQVLKRGGGVLCDKNNPVQIAEAIQGLAESPDRFRRLQSSAREVAKSYSWAALSQEYRILYESTIEAWERNMGSKWKYRSRPAKARGMQHQRRVELLYDGMNEGIALAGEDRWIVAARRVVAGISSMEVAFRRKLTIVRRFSQVLFARLVGEPAGSNKG